MKALYGLSSTLLAAVETLGLIGGKELEFSGTGQIKRESAFLASISKKNAGDKPASLLTRVRTNQMASLKDLPGLNLGNLEALILMASPV